MPGFLSVNVDPAKELFNRPFAIAPSDIGVEMHRLMAGLCLTCRSMTVFKYSRVNTCTSIKT